MDSCDHVTHLRPSRNHSILRPQRWRCSVCGTTESVYACLNCAHVACGRFNEEHSLQHYKESKHPIAIEVNKKHVYCYECDDYVLNDNRAGDLHELRLALSAITTQSFQDVPPTQQPLLRSFSVHEDWSELNEDDDKLQTAISCRRINLLRKGFREWRKYVSLHKKIESPAAKRRRLSEPPFKGDATGTHSLKRPAIIPGVTGLRNLGNTCYMNSILQVLSHIERFKNYFRKLLPESDFSPWSSPYHRASSSSDCGRELMRQNTMELFQHLSDPQSRDLSPEKRSSGRRVGLRGGQSTNPPSNTQIQEETTNINLSVCVELHVLFRVLWSGKWAQVSPHAFLQAVWNLMPDFKGYSQQDAQEFLCELLEQVERELRMTDDRGTVDMSRDIVNNVFQGKLTSQVHCEKCGHQSNTVEPFLDLSLEFPDRYQTQEKINRTCYLHEMLSKFTDVENLDGEIYACDQCNGARKKTSRTPVILRKAKKQLLIGELPFVLRLHLKRFRWSGRNDRGKICAHVRFEDRINMERYCTGLKSQKTDYRLTGVVVHHGTGFNCGHYTAYTWNQHADSWIYCNDDRLELCSLDKVYAGQAYILFYTRDDDIEPVPVKTNNDVIFKSNNKTPQAHCSIPRIAKPPHR